MAKIVRMPPPATVLLGSRDPSDAATSRPISTDVTAHREYDHTVIATGLPTSGVSIRSVGMPVTTAAAAAAPPATASRRGVHAQRAPIAVRMPCTLAPSPAECPASVHGLGNSGRSEGGGWRFAARRARPGFAPKVCA